MTAEQVRNFCLALPHTTESSPFDPDDLVFKVAGKIYAARNHWAALEHENALPAAEIKRRIKESYDLVFEKLPKKTQTQLTPAGKSFAGPSKTASASKSAKRPR